MENIEIFVFNRQNIQNFVTDRPYFFISISDPDLTHVEISDNPNQIARLDLSFWSVDKPDCDKLGISQLKVFNEDDAKAILTILKAVKPCINLIVINCEAGRERSAAVAGALSRILGMSDAKYFAPNGPYQPNRWIYRTILNTAVEMKMLGD